MDDYTRQLTSGRLDTFSRKHTPRRKAESQPPLSFRPPAVVPSGLDHRPRPDDGKGVVFAGQRTTLGEVRATVRLLSYYRRFLISGCDHARHPTQRWDETVTKEQARRELGRLVNVAINRKAGVPDVACRKQDLDYQVSLWRDCRKVRDHIRCRIVIHQFETAEIRERYGFLIREE